MAMGESQGINEPLRFWEQLLYKAPPKPWGFKHFRHELRKLVNSHMTWSEYMSNDEEKWKNTLKCTLIGDSTLVMELHDFLNHIGVERYTNRCVVDSSTTLRWSVWMLSNEIRTDNPVPYVRELVEFLWPIYRRTLDDRQFWESVCVLVKSCLEAAEARQEETSLIRNASPPPYVLSRLLQD